MIDISIEHLKKSGILAEQGKTEEEMLVFMNSFFPELKRWKKLS